MKNKRIWIFVALMIAVASLAPSVMAQPCQPIIPRQINLYESECISVCPYQQYAFFLWCPYPGIVNFPHLTLTPGCSQGDEGCNVACTAITPPRWPWIPGERPVFDRHNQIHLVNDCMDIYVYWNHDGYWVFEVWTNDCQGCFCLNFDWQLPVELTSFDAAAENGQVRLDWSTASESSNDYFEVVRSDRGVIAQIASVGNGPVGHTYNYTDSDVVNGTTYTYSLRSVDLSGTVNELNTVNATPVAGTVGAVTEYALYQNYPNPFNPTTQIMFDVPSSGNVLLEVYNPIGEKVATLINSYLPNNHYNVPFDGSNLTSGLYFYTLKVDNKFSATRKMLLVK
jgi:hypothetical protein